MEENDSTGFSQQEETPPLLNHITDTLQILSHPAHYTILVVDSEHEKSDDMGGVGLGQFPFPDQPLQNIFPESHVTGCGKSCPYYDLNTRVFCQKNCCPNSTTGLYYPLIIPHEKKFFTPFFSNAGIVAPARPPFCMVEKTP